MPNAKETIATQLEGLGISAALAEPFLQAVDAGGLELTAKGAGAPVAALACLTAERFKVCGVPGGFLTAVSLPGRGWIVWLETQCSAGRCTRHTPLFVAGVGGAFTV